MTTTTKRAKAVRKEKKKYLTTGQIASELEVANRTVHGWIDAGVLPGIRLPNPSPGKIARSHRRVRVEDFEKFKKEYGYK